MTDREMIEEMAIEIGRTLYEECLINRGHCDYCECKNKETEEYDCQNWLVAKKLLEKYQPKLPEDSVVLTKGAYESISSKAKANVVNAVEIRKETAGEILKELNRIVNKNAIKVNRDDYECGGFIYMIDCGDIALWLTEREKQYGVKIEE